MAILGAFGYSWQTIYQAFLTFGLYCEQVIANQSLNLIKGTPTQKSYCKFVIIHYNCCSKLIFSLNGCIQSGICEVINKTSDGGITALHMAALNGHVESVQLLLDLGASVSEVTVEDGTTIDLIGNYLTLPSSYDKVKSNICFGKSAFIFLLYVKYCFHIRPSFNFLF
jgi:hypothetical protein